MILLYLSLLPIHVLAVTFVYLTAPLWGLLSVALGRDTLPSFLRVLHTTDDTLDGGQHQLGWEPASGLALAWQRARWMWRNPAGGVASYVLGLPATECEVTVLEMQGVIDSGTALRRSRIMHWVRDPSDPKGLLHYPVEYFEYRRDVTWLFGRFAKLWFGWTIDTRAGRHRFQFQFNPFRKVPV